MTIGNNHQFFLVRCKYINICRLFVDQSLLINLCVHTPVAVVCRKLSPRYKKSLTRLNVALRHDLQNLLNFANKELVCGARHRHTLVRRLSTAAQPSALPSSATGGGRCSVPHEHARRSHNPNDTRDLNFMHITRNPSGECPRDFFGCGGGI